VLGFLKLFKPEKCSDFLKNYSFFRKIFLKEKKQQKKETKKKKTHYVMLGRGPASYPGRARVCGILPAPTRSVSRSSPAAAWLLIAGSDRIYWAFLLRMFMCCCVRAHDGLINSAFFFYMALL
jgi:hypothetical protein